MLPVGACGMNDDMFGLLCNPIVFEIYCLRAAGNAAKCSLCKV